MLIDIIFIAKTTPETDSSMVATSTATTTTRETKTTMRTKTTTTAVAVSKTITTVTAISPITTFAKITSIGTTMMTTAVPTTTSTQTSSALSDAIKCDGSINTIYECIQCFDGSSQQYQWGSSCSAKKLFSTIEVNGKCGLDYACVTTDIGDCPYNEYCPEESEGIFSFH